MTALMRRMALAMAGAMFLAAVPATAQENIDQGKTPAQLYASDCAICHKSPRGLSQAGGILGLQSFLREHYTASREAAAAIAAYVTALERQTPPPKQARNNKRPAKPGDKSSKSDKEEGTSKGTEQKPGDGSKSTEKPADNQASEAKPKEAAPADAGKDKPVDAKADGSKPSANSETKSDK